MPGGVWRSLESSVEVSPRQFPKRTGPFFRPVIFWGLGRVNLCYTAAMSVLRQVIVYSRKGCHLCEIVKETIAKLHRRGGFTWKEVDVDSDEQLRRQFTDEVPVVFIDGRKAFKYRMSEQEFLRKLAG
jgi:glutaredoxin